MTAIAQVDIRAARQRAGQIRQGIHSYLETLALIKQAWDERDWQTLGYDSWDQYVDTEFSDARLQLPPDHRQKVVVELRLNGMSQRAIGSTLGISQSTVNRDLAGDSFESPEQPETATGVDGKSYAATQPPRRTKTPDPPPTAPDPDQPDDTPAEAPLPGLDDGGDDSRVPPSDEAASAPTPAAGGTPDGQTPETGPSVPPGPASPSNGAGPGTAPAPDPRADVEDAMRRHLRPDPDEPYREWREAFLAAMAPAFRLMARFDVDHVVEQADDECLDELRRLAQEVGTYYEQVQAGRPAPNNVRHLRAV